MGAPVPSSKHLYDREEDNTMAPLVTLLLCLPAALALIACACGVAVLGPPAARFTHRPAVSRGRGGSSPE
jgi:hypothetical protein